LGVGILAHQVVELGSEWFKSISGIEAHEKAVERATEAYKKFEEASSAAAKAVSENAAHEREEAAKRASPSEQLERLVNPPNVTSAFDEVLRSPESSVRDRLDAARSIRELKGLDAPRKIASTNLEGTAAMPATVIDVKVLNLPQSQREALLAASFALRGIAGPNVEGQVATLDAGNGDGS
jgi:hypothetical protein